MSYISVEHLLENLVTAQHKFLRWATDQESRCDGAGCGYLLKKMIKDGRVREHALQEAIERASREVRHTQLQYEALGDVRTAVDQLPDELPDDPSAIIEPVSKYYTAVTEALRLAAREIEATSAEHVLKDLADETAAVIASEAWMGRDSSDYR